MIRLASSWAERVLAIPRRGKRLLVLLLDGCLCVLSVWLAHYLRLGVFAPVGKEMAWPIVASVALALPLFVTSGLYRAIFRYSGMPAMMAVGVARPNAHGQAITSTDTALMTARSQLPSDKPQASRVMAAIANTTGTNTALT